MPGSAARDGFAQIARQPLAWRFAVIAAIPMLVWAYDAILYDYVSDRAAGLGYEVRVNRLTGDACLHFRGRPPPDRLQDVAC